MAPDVPGRLASSRVGTFPGGSEDGGVCADLSLFRTSTLASSLICGVGVLGAEYGSVSAIEEPTVTAGDGYCMVDAGDAAFCIALPKLRLGV